MATRAYLKREHLNADKYPGLDISRASNGMVYVKGPAKLIKKYKAETKKVKQQTVRKMIKIKGNIKTVEGIKAVKKGNSYLLTGSKDKVEKYLKDNTKIDFERVRINKKYNKESFVAYPTNYTLDLESFTAAVVDSAYEKIDELIKKYKGIKVNFKINYSMIKGEEERGFFQHSGMFESINSKDLDILDIFSDMVMKIHISSNEGSGWKFNKTISMLMFAHKYTPLRGSSYVKYPKHIEDYVYNVQNEDEECFKWAILSKEMGTKKLSKLKENADKYPFNYPMKINDIEKFEKLYNKCIVVYSYDGNLFYPIYKSKNIIKDIDDIIQLLFYKNHYTWIRQPNSLFRKQNKNNWQYLCPICMCKRYKKKEEIQDHIRNGCYKNKAIPKLPSARDAKDYIQYTEYDVKYQFKNYFRIYLDFEAILINIKEQTKQTNKYRDHKSCGFACKIVSEDGKNDSFILYRGEDAGKHFIDSLLDTADKLIPIILQNNKFEGEYPKDYLNATKCYLCKKEFSTTHNHQKVLDHDHLTGEYRGAAHRICNLRYGQNRVTIPVLVHNLAKYDAHLILKAFEKDKRISCIANTTEKFLTFSIGPFKFIDTMSFTEASLDTLVETLKSAGKDKFTHFNNYFKTDLERELLLQKGVYPYDYMNSMERFEETKLPKYENFYNTLEKKHIDKKSYEHAQNVWDKLKIKNMGEYHDIYLKTDVLLLADCFERFRETAYNNYGLDCTHFITLPSFSWKAMLKNTNAKISVFSDIDMYHMIERGIRGGISVISKRYAKANNKYMKSFDPDKPSTYLMYYDANNLYGHSMSQYLPVGDYKWEKPEEFNKELIAEMTPTQETGYIFDVDLLYPFYIHDDHNDYPLAAESLTVTKDLLSTKYQINDKHKPFNKLCPNLMNKTNYVVHYRTLQYYIKKGLVLEKINKVMSFTQKPWIKDYIDFNTKKRSQSKYKYEQDMYKKCNNSVYGKTMENVRLRKKFELVNNPKRMAKLVNKPEFKDSIEINKNLFGVSSETTSLLLDKPIIVGFSILELSKLLMYEFHYDYIKPNYNAQLCFTDTDSLFYEIKTDDIYEDMMKNQEKFDFSEYPEDHLCYSVENKKVIGVFKDEANGKIITEFIGLRAKMYTYTVQDVKDSVKKAKGVKKSCVKAEITFQDYMDVLFGEDEKSKKMVTFNNIRSYNHELKSIQQTKIGLNSFDDKRYLVDKINTKAHGHCDLWFSKNR